MDIGQFSVGRRKIRPNYILCIVTTATVHFAFSTFAFAWSVLPQTGLRQRHRHRHRRGALLKMHCLKYSINFVGGAGEEAEAEVPQGQ